MIYADNAATTVLLPEARAAMLQAFDRYYGNPSSLHTPGLRARDALEKAREEMAEALGAGPREILFTSGGTESDAQAILGAGALGAEQGRRHIISSRFEHHAVLRNLERLEARGFSVTYLEVHENGLVRPEELEKALRPDTALVSVLYVNNEVGTVQPIAALGEICRRAGVLFHADAVQAVGHLPVDVVRDRVDLLSLSAHKFGGPRGTGALYIREGLTLPPLFSGGAQERGRRAGTENLPGILGMTAALTRCRDNMQTDMARVSELRDRLIRGLSAIPGARINGDPGHRAPGIVSACFAGISSESLLLLLDRRGICASAGAACASGALEPSHVLRAMGVPEELSRGALRLSLGPENTDREVDSLIRAVRETVSRLRLFA